MKKGRISPAVSLIISIMRRIWILSLFVLLIGCKSRTNTENAFTYDLDFLNKHTSIIVLKSGNSRVLIAPEWQARVMTSTSDPGSGISYGWINYSLIESQKLLPHINPFGGEERLWLGPEGGQYSLFFGEGDSFEYANWQTPALLDTEAFNTDTISDNQAEFSREGYLVNYSGYKFNFIIKRRIRILNENESASITGSDSELLSMVAYRSENILENTGKEKWEKETGLISVWMLGMFKPSPSTTVIIPYRTGTEEDLGPVVNDNYFGSVPADRLKYSNGTILFKADGRERGKIGLGPLRTKGIMGSYDSKNETLTLLICELPEGIIDYVNSSWELQEDPYSGDAYNSYNDGPLEDGSVMGPFYELETSSPALALDAGESYSHIQTTIHISGPHAELDKISRRMLGVSLKDI